jgi:hypothetical protein
VSEDEGILAQSNACQSLRSGIEAPRAARPHDERKQLSKVKIPADIIRNFFALFVTAKSGFRPKVAQFLTARRTKCRVR